MDVGIVTVGDELLAGRTENTNATWLCRQLTARGANVRHVVTVPDVIDRIAKTVATLQETYAAVIVTGGIGPTHDDVTMAAIAQAFDRELVDNDTAQEWLATEGGYSADDLDPKTTHLPEGADPLHNTEGVAPGASIEGVYVFPGVPVEMRAMFQRVADQFDGEPQPAATIHIDEPESALLGRFDALRDQFDVSVGSYPGTHVTVRLTGSEPAIVEEAATWLRDRVVLASPEEEPQPANNDRDAQHEDYPGGEFRVDTSPDSE